MKKQDKLGSMSLDKLGRSMSFWGKYQSALSEIRELKAQIKTMKEEKKYGALKK